MRLGSDGDIETKGVNRWRELGRFKEIADSVLDKRTGNGETDPGAQDLNQAEREFVEGYVSEVGDPDVITRHLDRNLREFGPGGANAVGIRREVRERLKPDECDKSIIRR